MTRRAQTERPRSKSRPRFTTKELSTRNWSDFETVFGQGNGWDFCACIAFQRGGGYHGKLRRAERAVVNHREKRELVEQARAHGIIVYADREPVGWCQFGPRNELPLPEYRRKSRPAPPPDGSKRWRITCFVTLQQHRREGITGIGLRAAIEAIRRKGGGIIEAFPVVTVALDPELKELVRLHGAESETVRRFILDRTGGSGVVYGGGPYLVEGLSVQGVGPVAGLLKEWSQALFPGTVATFQREGFKAVSVVGRNQVLMQRTVRRTPRGPRRAR